ncbi:unnamed protein product [Polarella glacialis]|uniref:Uncharacterized protein n=1 Tax=Polarella glacialis TaxID=89957 RepID=A0A813LLD6_POLGL|nr:unnamed protein product [Polarella glacialis]
MGAGASAGLSAGIAAASDDDLKQALAAVGPDVAAKLAAALAARGENAEVCSPTMLHYSPDGVASNVLPVSGPDSVARALVRGETERGNVEFFSGAGVGYALTGVDWIGLVNLGAKDLLEGAGQASALEGNEDFELVRSCYRAFGDSGTKEERTALLKRFGNSFLKLVKAYAQAIDTCMFAGSKAGMACSKTYNQFIAEFMSKCNATERCPTSLGRLIAQGILKQLRLRPDRVYNMYTTNYSRSVNMALLELGVTVEEVYPVRYDYASYSRSDVNYDKDVRLVRSVLTPVAAAAASGAVVRVFHMHGIAKGRAEFAEPDSPGPNRPVPFWSRQQHFDIGAAKDFFGADGTAISFAEPWNSCGNIRYQALPVGLAIEAAKAPELFEAAAEGILITDTQYGCRTHAKVLKSCFRLALDDTDRMIVIIGSSLTDAFFNQDLTENCDENGAVRHDENEDKNEALDDSDAIQACQGVTLDVGVKPNPKFMDGVDVKPELKPYLFFAVSCQADGTPDYAGIEAYMKACL